MEVIIIDAYASIIIGRSRECKRANSEAKRKPRTLVQGECHLINLKNGLTKAVLCLEESLVTLSIFVPGANNGFFLT
jgi:hypothetical protein